MDPLSLQDPGGRLEILKPPVGAGADHDLINQRTAGFLHRDHRVDRAGQGDERCQRGDIDVQRPRVARAGVIRSRVKRRRLMFSVLASPSSIS